MLNEHDSRSLSNNLTRRMAYDDSGFLEYMGEAFPGTLESVSKWKICKLIYAETSLVAILYAEGKCDYIHCWDDRDSYVYL